MSMDDQYGNHNAGPLMTALRLAFPGEETAQEDSARVVADFKTIAEAIQSAYAAGQEEPKRQVSETEALIRDFWQVKLADEESHRKASDSRVAELEAEKLPKPGITMVVTICDDEGHLRVEQAMETTIKADELNGEVQHVHQYVSDSLHAFSEKLEILSAAEMVEVIERVKHRCHTIEVLRFGSDVRYSWRVLASSGDFYLGYGMWRDHEFEHATGEAALSQAQMLLDKLFELEEIRIAEVKSAKGVKA